MAAGRHRAVAGLALRGIECGRGASLQRPCGAVDVLAHGLRIFNCRFFTASSVHAVVGGAAVDWVPSTIPTSSPHLLPSPSRPCFAAGAKIEARQLPLGNRARICASGCHSPRCSREKKTAGGSGMPDLSLSFSWQHMYATRPPRPRSDGHRSPKN
jgi:hypothetical protein